MTDVGSTKEEIKNVARKVADLAGREPIVLLVALALVLVEVLSVPATVAGLVPLLARWLVKSLPTAGEDEAIAFSAGHTVGLADVTSSVDVVANDDLRISADRAYESGYEQAIAHSIEAAKAVVPSRDASIGQAVENEIIGLLPE